MGIAVRNAAQASKAVRARWGALDKDEPLADLLRAEVHARRGSPRASVLRRVSEAMHRAVAEAGSADRLEGICSDLEARGDVVASRGGLLYPSPVRAITVAVHAYAIVASLPTHRLARTLPGRIDRAGTRRTLRFDADHEDAVHQAILDLSGVVITPRAWAGLELAPIADDDWLRALDERLSWSREAGQALEADGPLEWRGLVTAQDGPRWQRRATGDTRLWRARSRFGWWRFAWTALGEKPGDGVIVGLTSDEGARTVFALGRAAERPVRGMLARDEEMRYLRLGHWLPRAEYRYLSTLATPVREGSQVRWAIPAERASEILGSLQERLGLDVREEART